MITHELLKNDKQAINFKYSIHWEMHNLLKPDYAKLQSEISRLKIQQ